jgi:outer membrane lipopolysaccharide assembly protein LptE/RlpB
MIKKMTKSFLILAFLATSSCGYKVLESLDSYNLNIKEIKSSGDKRINFKIKNNLIFKSSQTNKINLIIDLQTTKEKKVKEKNIKNEITEYKILANTYVKLSFYEKDLNDEFTVTSSSNYLVGINTISNLQNERTAVESVANELSKKIRTRVLLILNDL